MRIEETLHRAEPDRSSPRADLEVARAAAGGRRIVPDLRWPQQRLVIEADLDRPSTRYRGAAERADVNDMRLRARARSSATATPGATLPLRAQALVPFALALAFVVAFAAVGAAVVARSAVDRELQAQAETARHLVTGQLTTVQQRLTAEVAELAEEAGSGAGRALEERMMAFSRREKLTLTAAVDQGAPPVGDGRLAWARLPFTHALIERARRTGMPASGTGRSEQDEPFLLAAMWLGNGRAVVVGRSVDRGLMGQVERATGVLVRIETVDGAQAESPDGTAGFEWPMTLDDGSRSRVQVSVASDARRAATLSSLLLVGGAGVLIVAALMLVLSRLLRRSVVRPVERLRAAMHRVEGGDYAARVAPSGAGEVRTLVAGFNDMATLVEAQRDRLQALAESDPLTGLANHRRFHQALEDTIGQARSAAVVVLDLDHFKFLNDTRGHPYGDQVLREVAAKLREAVRGAHDLVGRLGGEEFGILLADVGADEAFRVAERARVSIRGLPIDGFSLDCSAGVAAWPTDTDSPSRLLDLADAALYQAKRMGRGQTRRVDADSGEAAVDQQRAAVRRLLDDPQLITPVFQPIVDLATGRVAGYEGLSRFPAEDGRRPDEWFDLARRCGLGPLLQALALRRMIEVPGRPNRTWLSLNLDAGALATDAVQGALPPDLAGIVIEITEQELPPDDEALQRILDDLRGRGAMIALDDAGAGYAGLQHVVRIRPDVIKLDRSLVQGVDSDAERLALIESFVAFSARTGALLCAEGIETDEELAVLVDARVDLGQGYRLGRPGPPWASPAPQARRVVPRTA
jgi:diguanylate cyclase (GGDEF)-like protein